MKNEDFKKFIDDYRSPMMRGILGPNNAIVDKLEELHIQYNTILKERNRLKKETHKLNRVVYCRRKYIRQLKDKIDELEVDISIDLWLDDKSSN